MRQAPEAGRLVAWQDWRAARNHLFRSHPQSPLDAEQRDRFRGLAYYDYDALWRIVGTIDLNVAQETFEVDLGADGRFQYSRCARALFTAAGIEAALSLFWIEGYGGGLFLPFGDTTNRHETYGGGRYLYDTIKGADLGAGSQSIVLDFNFAYNPSCAYHPRWVCPLPPAENDLPFAVRAGEMRFN